MNRYLRYFLAGFCLLVAILSISGCMRSIQQNENDGTVPEIPAKLSKTDDGTPILTVHNIETGNNEEMDIETYLMGVVAGEMKNDWPMEALKAQAILARTFTMRFVSSKDSVHQGADISTDITEAQAYNADAINDRVREAVNETRGTVMVANGEFPYAWFHAHSGGSTELPSKALEYKEDPSYLRVVNSREADAAPAEVKQWTVSFPFDAVRDACRESGLEIESIASFEIGKRGESGRAVTFLVNGKEVSAPSFRLHIGASELKSTLLDSVSIKGDSVEFTGRGFGHGVGMSQWGAYQLADEGKTARDIIKHYYTGVELIELW